MIIWLASYQKWKYLGKSNSFIFNLLKQWNIWYNLLKKIDQFPEKYFEYVKDFGNFNLIKQNWILAQDKVNLDNNIKIFKTHQGKYS